MKNSFRAHFLMSLRLIKPFLFVLVLPLIKGGIQYLLYRKISGVWLLEAVLVAIIVTIALVRCYTYTVTVAKRELIVKNGIFIRATSHIPKDKISSIYISRGILDRVFGSAICHINTEAGRKGSPDFIFKLSHTDAIKLSKLLYGGEKQVKVVFSPLKIALLAAATSSSVTGLVVGVPIMNQIGKLLDLALEQMILDEISHAADKASVYVPPIFSIITLVLLITYGFAVTVSFFKNVNFKLSSDRHRIEVRSGLITRRRTIFNKRGVNNLCIEQNPLMRVFRTYSMYASIGGYGNKKGEKAVVVPCGRKQTVQYHLSSYFPHLKAEGTRLSAKRSTKMLMRFLYVPRLIALLTIIAAVSITVIFAYFDRLVIFIAAAILLISGYYANVCYNTYKNGGLSFGDTVYARGMRFFTFRELYCERERVGIIRISQTPADRRYNTCKVKITMRSESADRVKVRNLDLDEVNREISENFAVS